MTAWQSTLAPAMLPRPARCGHTWNAHGLTPLIVAFPKSIESLRETLIMAKDFGAPFVDVIGQVMPLSVDGMIPVIRRMDRYGGRGRHAGPVRDAPQLHHQ